MKMLSRNWWSFVFILTTHFLPDGSTKAYEIQERVQKFPVKTAGELSSFIRDQNMKRSVPDFIGKVGIGTAGVQKIDFKKPVKEVIADIGDVVVPLVSLGLSLIPGIGPIIGGAMSFVYGLFSPLLRGNQESPMQKMINSINKELENIHRKFEKMEEKIKEDLRKERNAQLSNIMNRAFHGEMSRNEYVCNKYARLSKLYVEDLKKNRTIDESLRIEMIAIMQDCDNFLKDTTEGFVHPEFADVLWLPSVITTLIRISFLTEVANYGVSLKIDEDSIFMFWQELKTDIKRHLTFFIDVVKQRVKTLHTRDNLTSYEYEACKLQKQVIYFDRQIYPFGVPDQTVISKNDTEVRIADFNITAGNDDTRHIQVFYNVLKHRELRQPGEPPLHSVNSWQMAEPKEIVIPDHSSGILNCIMGPTMKTHMSYVRMTLRITYVPQKSYQVRVLYFIREGNTNYGVLGYVFYDRGLKKKLVSVVDGKEGDSSILMRITDQDPSQSPERFDFKTAIYYMNCPISDPVDPNYDSWSTEPTKNGDCHMMGSAQIGRFVVETVLLFNVLSYEDAKSTIIVENANPKEMDILIFGVELIVRPVIS